MKIVQAVFVILMILFYRELSFCQNILSCNCEVYAGQDIEICGPGLVQLNGDVSGDYVSFAWDPAPELNNINLLSPLANLNKNTSFILTAICGGTTFVPIDNGDFSNGNVGFTTEYIYDVKPGTFYPGRITVTTNPKIFNSLFYACPDHTDGTGKILLVDGSDVAGTNFWCEDISVDVNKDYVFEFWTTKVHPLEQPQIEVTVDGIPVGGGTPEVDVCNWKKIIAFFTPKTTGIVSICMRETTGAFQGNDFAIDDITLKETCKVKDTVNINLAAIKTTKIVKTICEGDTYTNGNNTFNIEGNYIIPYKTWEGCDSLVSLELNLIKLDLQIENPSPLTCKNSSVFLKSINSSMGMGYTYEWKTLDGEIISDPLKQEIEVNKPGTYELTLSYTDGSNICTKSTNVEVITDTIKPLISAGNSDTISCKRTLIKLNGAVSSNETNLSYLWTTTNGNISAGQNTLNPIINLPGIYNLTVYNLDNGCSTQSSLLINEGESLKEYNLYFPNVFSPNADGINDIWYVQGNAELIDNIKLLRIFDRWGELIFEKLNFPANEPAYGWNGKFRGKYLNPAVFVYYLEAEFIDCSTIYFKGDVTIVK